MNLVELTIQAPDNSVATRAQQALARAEAFTIVDDASYSEAAENLKAAKGRFREIDEARKELKRPIDVAAARIQAFFKAPLDFCASEETIWKRKLGAYQAEQERLRIEAQRKAEAQARKEREEIEARAREAESKARAKAEADRRLAEEAAAAGRAEEAAKLQARADRTENKGAEKAQQLEMQAASVVAPVIQREAPKVAGLATREVWRFEVTDPTKVNAAFMSPDLEKIGKTVKALKLDAVSVIGPGVRVFADKSIASGTR